jgi:threonine synthase
VTQLCECGSPLLVRYDLARAAASVSKEKIYSRGSDLWRYREFLPVREERHIVSLGEGMTPMLRLNRTGQATGMARLYMKDEGIIPTGTFKARGAAVGVSKALELGVKALAMPTNGNAGGAWAAYCAAAGIRAVIAMPEDAPRITRSECVVTGASLWLVKGLISDAGKIIGRAVKRYGLYDASTLKEPYRIEGKKTMGLEIAEQFGWEVPDVILYPTGGGVGLIGIYKALLELREIGWIGEKMPRLVAVQAEGCAPIVRAWQEKKTDSVFFEKSKTIAFGINVPKALGDFLVLDAVYRTGGAAVAVSDEEILNALSLLGRMEGAFVCPEGAATLAAAKKLRDEGWISPEERVVLLNTGTGIKYPETVHVEAPLLAPDDEIEL